jgi:hypothetical protein
MHGQQNIKLKNWIENTFTFVFCIGLEVATESRDWLLVERPLDSGWDVCVP